MAPFIRIFLRYAIGILAGYSILENDVGQTLSNDPDLIQAIELALVGLCGAATEFWYLLSRRFGWAK